MQRVITCYITRMNFSAFLLLQQKCKKHTRVTEVYQESGTNSIEYF